MIDESALLWRWVGLQFNLLFYRRLGALTTVGFFAVLTILFTLPVALDLNHRFASGLIDPPFTMWTMAWEAHALEANPAALFDANIFYPEPAALAFSSLNFAPMLVAFPILRASGNPILAYNFAYLFAWWLIGFGTFLFTRKVGIGMGASLIAGALAEFSPFSFGQLGHLEILWVGWIPLFLLAASNLIGRGKPVDFVLALIFFLMESLATWYFAIYLTLAAVGLAFFVARRMRWRDRRKWAKLVAVLGLGWVVMLPLLLTYLQIAPGYARTRTLEQAQYYSARLDSYFQEPAYNRTWRALLGTGDHGESNMFPGIVFSLLATLGIGQVWRDNTAGTRGKFLILLGATSLVLTFGPTLKIDGQAVISLPENLFRLLSGYAMTRVPARWAIFAFIAFAVCAGVGAERLARRRPVVLGVLFLIAMIENFSVPLPTSTLPTWDTLEPEYRWLAAQPSQVVVEMPMLTDPESSDIQVGYLYRSIFHHQRMVNGYADYVPDWYANFAQASREFPDDKTLGLYRKSGVQLVLVHMERFAPLSRDAIATEISSAPAPLRLAASFGDVWILKLDGVP